MIFFLKSQNIIPSIIYQILYVDLPVKYTTAPVEPLMALGGIAKSTAINNIYLCHLLGFRNTHSTTE